MPRTTEVLEELARRYYLTTALVEEAGRLFDAYADNGEAPLANGSTEPFIGVSALQRLTVKMGSPFSQQDLVELLRFFGGAAAAAMQVQGEPLDSLANGQQLPIGKGSRFATAATAPASQQPSRQRRKKNGATEAKTGTKDASASFSGITSSHSVGDKFCGDVASASSSAAPLAATACPYAVTEDGMSFSAFLYFLLVYPELAQQASATVATRSTTSRAVANALQVSIPELFAMIDADGDGVWSAHDLRHAAEACVMEDDGLLQEDPDLCRLAEMHPVEIAAVLHELDVDGDGVVTVSDVRQALCP
ncbi:hypothetical protein GH5_05375 [Leishmania sp. Ghana 2012 LV757]|uniref:hypothetical protein n=1 Tax=Leishmania sp. Ghana 2012 LV757 TaxID=2803181 RepID=UPI001B5A0FE1|nr:hypothetical protein GH5_05375 [Leishmania sp. Ghana 2012 LV757]